MDCSTFAIERQVWKPVDCGAEDPSKTCHPNRFQPVKLNPQTKLAHIRTAMADGDWDRAITLAARFQSLGQQGPAIRRARDAMTNPELYKQLGRDAAAIRREGIAAIKDRFS